MSYQLKKPVKFAYFVFTAASSFTQFASVFLKIKHSVIRKTFDYLYFNFGGENKKRKSKQQKETLRNKMEEETHKNKLSLLCFVCGEFFKKSFHVSTHLKNLRKAFYIYDETSYSDENIYPQKFCRKCYLKLMNILKRKTTTTPISIPVWEKHTPGLCKVCTVEKGTQKVERERK